MAQAQVLPRHVAVIMDGNGRWAAARGLTRTAGHKAGLAAVRMCIEECSQRGVEALTLFAFSSENWRRPAEEVLSLMTLFIEAIDREVSELDRRRVRMRFIGERKSLSVRLQARIAAAEERTAANSGLRLQVAMSYGGRWDVVQAAQQLARECASGALRAEDISEARFGAALALAGLPQTDLLIRTGAEQRLSNFLLWDLAYAELYFSAQLWPDFTVRDLEEAFAFFAGRERRFGQTAAQHGAVKA
ncbi:MAG TPA: polyprenyl diphosphate synthase [Steroidobacteraceae bacterium]|jgi:undecaprenyl diphosphate synthase|nr:polyprenyl diphosphate synthase [Steroidobacteraceae bacterium]